MDRVSRGSLVLVHPRNTHNAADLQVSLTIKFPLSRSPLTSIKLGQPFRAGLVAFSDLSLAAVFIPWPARRCPHPVPTRPVNRSQYRHITNDRCWPTPACFDGRLSAKSSPPSINTVVCPDYLCLYICSETLEGSKKGMRLHKWLQNNRLTGLELFLLGGCHGK